MDRLASRVARPYPAGHDALIRRTRESGAAVVSRSPCGSTPSRWRLPQQKVKSYRSGGSESYAIFSP